MKRGVDILAEETHASPLWGTVLLLPLVGLISVAKTAPPAGIHIVLVVVGVILIGAAAMAWTGFRYVFTSHGLEIRTLGFCVRTIAAEQIREYSVAPWSIARGYGIRGLGDRRAYVWGNTGVRIKTTEGEVFLGHRDPSRIIHDLDLIKQFAH